MSSPSQRSRGPAIRARSSQRDRYRVGAIAAVAQAPSRRLGCCHRRPGKAGAPPAAARRRKAEKPVYKWWFWAIVGVSALILIDVASSDSSSNNNALVLPDASRPSSPDGAVLWRF